MGAWFWPLVVVAAAFFAGALSAQYNGGGQEGLAATDLYGLVLPAVSRQAGPSAAPTAIVLPTPTATLPPTATPVPTPPPTPAFRDDQLFSLGLHNKARLANGAPPLMLDAAVNAAAQGQANDMAARDYFSHDSPEGKTPWDWLRESGATYTYAGQNLGLAEGAANTQAIQELFDMMVAETPPEDGHRRNILDTNFRKLGIGLSRSASGKLYWVVNFTG
ncbi:MAG: CAP domain-containing protein [Chloroflexi bacterium]|nr:CAP domain-containing protein [Chloroflexota bacterium]